MTTIQGELVASPGAPGVTVTSPRDGAARDIRNVLSALVNASPAAFSNESSKLSALDAVHNFAHQFADTRPELREEDTAPVEDVTKRIPPLGFAPVPQQNVVIDYNALARAIVAQQALMAASAGSGE